MMKRKKKADKGKQASAAKEASESKLSDMVKELNSIIEEKEKTIEQLESRLSTTSKGRGSNVYRKEPGPPALPFDSEIPPNPWGSPREDAPPPFFLDGPPSVPFDLPNNDGIPPLPFSDGLPPPSLDLKSSLLSFVADPNTRGSASDSTIVKELEARVRSLVIDINELNKLVEHKDTQIKYLEITVRQQIETVGDIIEIEGIRDKLKNKLRYKDSIVDDLKKQVIARKRELGYLKESTEGINIDKKYDTVISSLREELTVKEKTIEDLYGKLQAREDDFSDREKLQHKNDELSRTVNALKEELGTRKDQLAETEKLVSIER